MQNLSDDTKALVASNLTLAWFIREHMFYAGKDVDLQKNSHEAVDEIFNQYLKNLEK